MVKIREEAKCNAVRLFLWNEKLTRNQISESEGLCVFLIRSTYLKVFPGLKGSCAKRVGGNFIRMVIPFDLSKLLNKDASLGSMLVFATLQFLPETIKHLGEHISSYLFTKFHYTMQSPPQPTYVIALEISHIRFLDFTDIDFSVLPKDFQWLPPRAWSCNRFKRDWDEEKEEVTTYGVSSTDCWNDPYNGYPGDVLEYIKTLRTYTGEGGTCPTKPPISADVPRGFVEVQPSAQRSCCRSDSTISLKDLIDDTCAVCHEEFKDEVENEVIITTYCSHSFHARCLLPWLSRKNNCPTCREVYPLHYSPLLIRYRH